MCVFISGEKEMHTKTETERDLRASVYSIFPIKITGIPPAGTHLGHSLFPDSTQEHLPWLTALPPGKPASRFTCQNPTQAQCHARHKPSSALSRCQLSLLSGVSSTVFESLIFFPLCLVNSYTSSNLTSHN